MAMNLRQQGIIYILFGVLLSLYTIYHFHSNHLQKALSTNLITTVKLYTVSEAVEDMTTLNPGGLKLTISPYRLNRTEVETYPSELLNHRLKVRDNICDDFLSENRSFIVLDEVGEMVLYSAHYDYTDKTVKLVGFGPRGKDVTRQLLDYQCNLVDEKGNVMGQTPISIHYRMTRDPGRPDIIYDTIIYSCGTCNVSPHSLTVISKHSKASLLIEPTPSSASPIKPRKFSVCVKPMYNYSNVDMLKNFIAVNTALGAEHFYFYIYSASLEVISTLSHLKEKVTLYQWPLGNLTGKVHAYGQKTHNAHCLYSHKSANDYLLFVDIDEILVPSDGRSWSSMMDGVINGNPQNGAVVFRSQLYPLNAPLNVESGNERLISLRFTKTTGLFPYYHWSKILVDTSRTDNVDIHWVNKLYPGFEVTLANRSYGFIYHYRNFMYNYNEVYDDSSLSFYHRGNILNAYSQLFG